MKATGRLLLGLSLVWLLGFSFLPQVRAAIQADESRPSVFLITVDTLRADRLGAYGYEPGKTPVIDGLAGEGILFENAIVQTPITLPSHASILTGTYPFFHGLQDVVGRLREDLPTLAEWFRDKGYRTSAFVGASVLMAHWGLDRGFQFYEDTFEVQGLAQIDFSRAERPANRVVDLAVNWLDSEGSGPFFLWLHLYDPHDPYMAPEPYGSEFKSEPYDGEVAFTDAMLGRFFDKLKEKGIYENSLIIFTSDHGESLGEHGEKYHAYYIYEASLRVPLIFKVPEALSRGRIAGGQTISAQVRSIDILPTILQLMGERVPSWAQGESLVGMMAGRRRDQSLPAYAETHYPRVHFGWSPLFSYSDGKQKFIEAPIPEFYNLEKDPQELDNVFETQQALAKGLQEQMHALQQRYISSSATGDQEGGEMDPEMMERLKSLGYVAFSSGTPKDGSRSGLADPKLKIDIFNQLNDSISLSREGKTKEAVQILRSVAEQEREMPIVHFLLGMEYLNQGLFLQAVQEFRETITRNPESNVARFNLARSYARAGLSSEAEEAARDLLEKEPNHFGAHHLLASLLAKHGRLEEAIAEELKAIQIRPHFSDAHNSLASYYLQTGKTEEAVQHYRTAIQYTPNNLMARSNLALAYLQLKKFDLALQEAREVVRANPRDAISHFYVGQALLGLGRQEEARVAFQKARELNPRLTPPDF